MPRGGSKKDDDDFRNNRDGGLKVKQEKPFSEEDIPEVHMIEVGTDYFGRWVVTIADLDTGEVTKLYERPSGGKYGH
jgi:hypothetical protein